MKTPKASDPPELVSPYFTLQCVDSPPQTSPALQGSQLNYPQHAVCVFLEVNPVRANLGIQNTDRPFVTLPRTGIKAFVKLAGDLFQYLAS